VVAAGKVAGVWTEVPEDAELAEIKAAFANSFGRRWEGVVVGTEREVLFRFWEAYVGVVDLKPHPELNVARLREEDPTVPVVGVLLG
jgi:hypothetical protein